MNGSHIINQTENAELSQITEESTEVESGLTLEQKKRKIEDIYCSAQWQEEDEYEVAKIRQIVRNHIFKHVKFVKGEGVKSKAQQNRKKAKRKQIDLFGKSHERPDLTIRNGYAYNIMRFVGLDKERTSITRRALWWKTYNVHVHQEIRQLRGRMNAAMKNCISKGKKRKIEHESIYR